MSKLSTLIYCFLAMLTISCSSISEEQEISYMKTDTLHFQINEQFLTYYDRSYTATTESGQTIFYGFNHTRNTIDRINLHTGEMKNLKPCNSMVYLNSGSSVGVVDKNIIIQNNTSYQRFKINLEINCLDLVNEVNAKSLTNNTNFINPGLVVLITPDISPAWVDNTFYEGFYPFLFEQIPRIVAIDPINHRANALEIILPNEIKEKFRPYTDLAKPLLAPMDNNKLSFIFSFSDLIFTYDLNTKELIYSSIPGESIKGQVSLPEKEEDLRIWQFKFGSLFHNLIWDPENRYFYRVEIIYDPIEDEQKRSIFFNRHYISIISEDLRFVHQVKVPKNCYSIPLPMGDRLYFMHAQNFEEDAIMFIGVPFPKK